MRCRSRAARQAGAFDNAKATIKSADSDIESHYGTIFSVSGPGACAAPRTFA